MTLGTDIPSMLLQGRDEEKGRETPPQLEYYSQRGWGKKGK